MLSLKLDIPKQFSLGHKVEWQNIFEGGDMFIAFITQVKRIKYEKGVGTLLNFHK